MQIKYSWNAADNCFVAENVDKSIGYISGAYTTVNEMIEDMQLQLESILLDDADDFNTLQESRGSFTRFAFPKAEFVKEEWKGWDE